MLNHRKPIVAAAFSAFFFALLLVPVQGWSAGLPEGVSVDVIAEYPVDIPGIEKVVLKKITLEPGAKLANFPENDTTFCHATAGTITVVDHANGTTTIYTEGARWAPQKGATYSISNPGDVTHVHWVYALVETQ